VTFAHVWAHSTMSALSQLGRKLALKNALDVGLGEGVTDIEQATSALLCYLIGEAVTKSSHQN
jgi:hypothetical protein